MTSTHRRAIQWGITALMLVLLVLYARTVQWSEVWRAIRAADARLLLAAFAANMVTLVAKAVTWWIFLRPVGARSYWLALRATIAGAAINNLVIANGGEAARLVFVTRAARIPSSGVLAALAMERLLDLVGYVALFVLALALLPVPAALARWRLASVGVLALLALILAMLLRRAPVEATARAAARPHRLPGRIRGYLRRVIDELRHITTGRRLAAAALPTAVVWATQLATYHLTARAAHFPITLEGSVVTLITVNVAFLIRATPGNVGVFQLVYALTAQALGLDKEAAIGVALILQALQNVPVTLLGAALSPELVLTRRPLDAAAAEVPTEA